MRQEPTSRRYAEALILAVLVLGGLLLTSGNALGQSYDDLAKADQGRFEKFLDRCIRAYDKKQYDKAEGLCGQAEDITPHPATRYLVARIRDRNGQCEEAVSLYRKVLDGGAAGNSEARWLQEYRQAIEKNLEDLGDCSARLEVTCAKPDEGALVTSGTKVLGTCPGTLITVPGTATLSLSMAGKETATKDVDITAGRPVSVSFKALSKAREPKGDNVVRVSCPDFGSTAVVSIGGVILGVCPVTLELSPGSHLIVAETADGSRGLARVQVPKEGGADARIAPLRQVGFRCSDAAAEVRIDGELLEETLERTCGDLSASGVELAEGGYTVTVSKGEGFEEETLQLEITGAGQTVELEALSKRPVSFTVSCADSGEPPVYVRIGSRQGQCPLSGKLPEGSYELEARRDGHSSWSDSVTLSLGGPAELTVPAMEPTSFFSPGVITAFAGGGLLIVAVAIDVAGKSDLDDLNGIYEDCTGGDRPDGCFLPSDQEGSFEAAYDELQPTVERNILLTRIFYGASVAVLGTAVGLIIYELVSDDPGEFADEGESVHLSPAFSPDGSSGGLSLTWTF